MKNGHLESERLPLQDEFGPIPTFPPLKRDDSGRYILPSEEERKARDEAFSRAVRAIASIHDETDDDDDRWREILNNLGVPMVPDPLQKSE